MKRLTTRCLPCIQNSSPGDLRPRIVHGVAEAKYHEKATHSLGSTTLLAGANAALKRIVGSSSKFEGEPYRARQAPRMRSLDVGE